MDHDKQISAQVLLVKELNERFEQTLRQDSGLAAKASKFNTLDTPILRSILFGICGLILGPIISILIAQFATVNLLLLTSTLAILLSTLGIVVSLYWMKGGVSAVFYDVALQDNEKEINRQRDQIGILIKMKAPQEAIDSRWKYLEVLENERIALLQEKSTSFLDKQTKNRLKRNKTRQRSTTRYLPQSADSQNNEVLELKGQINELKEKVEELQRSDDDTT